MASVEKEGEARREGGGERAIRGVSLPLLFNPPVEISYYCAVTFLLSVYPPGKIPKDLLFLTVDFVTATRIRTVQLDGE